MLLFFSLHLAVPQVSYGIPFAFWVRLEPATLATSQGTPVVDGLLILSFQGVSPHVCPLLLPRAAACGDTGFLAGRGEPWHAFLPEALQSASPHTASC